MSVRIGNQEFEHATYDELGDVLYLRNGEVREAASTHATPEGHAVRFDQQGAVIGLTIVNARWLAERGEELVVTVPDRRIEVSPGDVTAALEHSLSK